MEAENVRGYPEISFVDTDTDTLVNAMITAYEKITGRTLYRADPARLFILWVADFVVQLLVNIDFSAKQNLPRYAEGKYLDSIAEIFKDVYRLEPEAAKTTLRFTLSAPQDIAITVAEGTRVTPDNQIFFATSEELLILAGKTSGEVAAECMENGENGNGFVPGQINQLVDVFPYYESVCNTTKSEGGADQETDAAFYLRMRESMESFSTAGPLGSYVYWAKTASALISDIKAVSPTPGVVDVRVLLQDGELPDAELLQTVYEKLNADDVRPLTDEVYVNAPEVVKYNIDFTYYMPQGSAVSAEVIEAEVRSAVTAYITWQSERMGRDINPSYLNYLLMQTNIKRVDIRGPAFTAVDDIAVAQVGEIAAVNGGYEYE